MKPILLIFTLFTFQSIHAQHFSKKWIEEDYTLQNLVAADFDGDGDKDVLGLYIYWGNTPSELSWLKNDGKGNFEGILINKKSNAVGQPTIGDFDGDGDIDVILSIDVNKQDLNILTNDGSGEFTMSPLGISGSSKLKSADMDGDGDMDFVGISFDETVLNVYINTNGSFELVKTFTSDRRLRDFDLGDINGNRKIDIIVVEYEYKDPEVMVYLNEGDSKFTKKVINTEGSFNTSVSIADMNGDNKNDILFSHDEKFYCLVNQGNLTFTTIILGEQKTFGGYNFNTFEIADIDNDGDLDALMGTTSGDASYWYKNLNRDKVEKFEEIELDDFPPLQYVIGEFTGDNKLDYFAPLDGNLLFYTNEISTGVALISETKIISYPNPTSNNITIENIDLTNVTLNLFDSNGQFIKKLNNNTNSIDVGFLIPGTYFLNIPSDGRTIVKKIIIK